MFMICFVCAYLLAMPRRTRSTGHLESDEDVPVDDYSDDDSDFSAQDEFNDKEDVIDRYACNLHTFELLLCVLTHKAREFC